MASMEEDYMRWMVEDDDEDIIEFLRVVRGNKVIKKKRSCWVRCWLKDRFSTERNTMYKLQQELRVRLYIMYNT